MDLQQHFHSFLCHITEWFSLRVISNSLNGKIHIALSRKIPDSRLLTGLKANCLGEDLTGTKVLPALNEFTR